MKRFLVFFPFWVALITGINIWHDLERGAPFNPMHLVYALGFLIFTGFLFLVSRWIFRFVRAYARHQEREP